MFALGGAVYENTPQTISVSRLFWIERHLNSVQMHHPNHLSFRDNVVGVPTMSEICEPLNLAVHNRSKSRYESPNMNCNNRNPNTKTDGPLQLEYGHLTVYEYQLCRRCQNISQRRRGGRCRRVSRKGWFALSENESVGRSFKS